MYVHTQGKYMEIQFDMKGDPEGGRITNCMCTSVYV